MTAEFEFDTALGTVLLRHYGVGSDDPCRYCRVSLARGVEEGLVSVVAGPAEDGDVLRARLSGSVEGIRRFLVHQGGLLWAEELGEGSLGLLGVFGDGSAEPDGAALRALRQAGASPLDSLSLGKGRYLVPFAGSGSQALAAVRTLGDGFAWSTHVPATRWDARW